MAASSGGLEPEPVTDAQATCRLGAQLLAVEQVAPRCAGLSAVGARRGVTPALGDERVLHLRERLDLADDAVAPVVAPGAAAAAPARVLDDAQRELDLQRLDRRVERVGHRDVHGAGAVGVRAGALAAAERLVVGEVGVAEREVVHRPLAERAPERGEDEVGHPRRRLDVAARHGGRAPRVEQRALGGAHLDRAVGAGARRDVGIGQDADGEEARGPGDGERAVEVALVLASAALEVERQAVPVDGGGEAQLDVPVGGLEHVGRRARAVGQLAQARARPALGVVEDLGRRLAQRRDRRRARRDHRAAARRRGWRRAAPAGPPGAVPAGASRTRAPRSPRRRAPAARSRRPPPPGWWSRRASIPATRPPTSA